MAAGDRYKNDKPKDIVRHYGLTDGGKPYCKQRNAGYVSSDTNDVNCKKCLIFLKITPTHL